MCNLMFGSLMSENNNIKIKMDEYVYRHLLDGTAYKLLSHFKSRYDADFYFVIGQDNADSITTWKYHEELLNEFKFIVVPRIYEHNKLTELSWYQQEPHIMLKYNNVNDISSTQVRNLIQEYADTHPDFLFKELSELLCDDLIIYIMNHRLYQGD